MAMNDTLAEVLVCGAGPVGLSCAYVLASAGMDVMVVDAADTVDASPRAAFHHAPTVVALEALGLLEDLHGVAYTGGQMGRHTPEYDYLRKIDFDGMMVGQDAICNVLMDRLRAMPNAQVLMGTQLTSLGQESDRVRAELLDPSGSRSMTCRWLVGADGARSAVRKLSGIPFEGHTWNDRVYAANVIYDFAGIGLADGQFRTDPHSWAVIVRLNAHGTWRVAFGDDGMVPLENEIAHATARLSEFVPADAPFELLQLSPYRTHQRAASKMRLDRVILIGDAAHITAPWGGLGLTTGFWDAFILGDLLPEVAAGKVSDSALDAFSRERLRVYHQLTSPAATENRRVLHEQDPVRRRRDLAEFDALAESAEMQQAFKSMSWAFVGNPIIEKSRWIRPAA